jgi:predicted AlkP superfamily phosphohydrolase/phosphomutase
MTARVLFLGLDGAEPELIRKWAAAGELPNLRVMLANWFARNVDTPKGFGDGVFWATLFTGCNAGRHGHYFPWQFNTQTYGTTTFSFDDHYRRDPFWLHASRMGRRVGIFDIYSSPLTQGIDGVQVMNWMIHDRTSDPKSWPEPILASLHEKYMKDPLGGNSEAESRTESEWVAFHQGLVERIDAKCRAMVDLVSSNRWDLFAAGFCDAHDVGHQSWHWHDRDATDHPRQWRERYGDPVLKVYRKLDSAVGAIVNAAGSDAVFLVAGIGMGRQTTCNPVLDPILGYLSGHRGNRAELRKIRRLRPWFDIPHNMNSGALRINLKGRERNGIVEPDDYDSTCDFLIESLAGVTDTDTGLPVVADAARIRRDFSGPFTDQLPDLMIIWQRERPVRAVDVPGMGTIAVVPEVLVESRSGDHTPNALFVSSTHYDSERPVIATEAIAPTIGRSIGISIPGSDASPLMNQGETPRP